MHHLEAGERPGPRAWIGATLIVADAVLATF
jgi:hypothetical protein